MSEPMAHPTRVQHGVTIETVRLPAGNPLRAVCLCGWQSPIVGSRPQAVAAGEKHVAEAESFGTRTRASHCSCGRPAREVLDGGEYGPTGYCGAPNRPLDPCNCSYRPHDKSVCHIYGVGMVPMSSTEGGSMTSTAVRETLPLVQCKPWCVDQDGHPDCDYVEDKVCTTAEQDVDLSMYPLVPNEVRDEAGNWLPGPDHLRVYGLYSPVEPVQVRLNHDATASLPFFDITLTPAEAKALLVALFDVVGQIEAGR